MRELSYSAIRTVGHRANGREHTFELHRTGGDTSPATNDKPIKETTMKWETPAASDMRFGFEITMYIANR